MVQPIGRSREIPRRLGLGTGSQSSARLHPAKWNSRLEAVAPTGNQILEVSVGGGV